MGLLERALHSGTAIAGYFGLADIAKLFTDPASQQLAFDRLTDEKILPDPRAKEPSDLFGAGQLRPRYQKIKFTLRNEEIENFRSWCADSEKKLSVRLVTGGSGRGKTRLMVELAGSLRDNGPKFPGYSKPNWAAGFLDVEKLANAAGQGMDGPFSVPFASNKDLCLVVDYAESLPEIPIVNLLKSAMGAMDAGRSGRTRIILIARQRTEVFDLIMRDRDLCDRADVRIHEEVLAQVSDPPIFFQAACEALKVPETARSFPRNLDPDCGLLALAALLAATEQKSVATASESEILNNVLDHERRYWEQMARRFQVPEALLRLNVQEQVAATLTLYGLQGAIADMDAAVDLVSQIPLLADQPLAVRTAMVRAISELYPHPEGAIEGVGLDLLGDHAVRSLVGKDLCPAGNAAQIRSALTRITWLARRGDPAGQQLLHMVLRQNPEDYLENILTLAPTLGDPLGALAADFVEKHPIDPALAIRLERKLPVITVTLRELAAIVTRQAITGPDLPNELRAGLLNNLAVRLSDLGQHEEALTTAQEAAGLYRDLAKARPEAFTPDLAKSLNTLAIRLSTLGQYEEALTTAQEAAGLYRDLAKARPEAFTPDLAKSLNNLANFLSDLGQYEEALTTAQEAVDLRRDLAKARPEAFTPDLAMSLSSLAIRLSALGQHQEALTMAQEAAGLYRDLTKARPEAFTPDLAASLNNLANRLSALGQYEEALTMAQEAVGLYRDLAKTRPEAFTPDLAMSLNNLANRLSALGQHKEALTMAQEAVGLYRDLAKTRPEAFTPNLVRSLGALSRILDRNGFPKEASKRLHEGISLIRPHFLNNPLAFAGLTRALCRHYVEACSESEAKPDTDLLSEIVEVFEALEPKQE